MAVVCMWGPTDDGKGDGAVCCVYIGGRAHCLRQNIHSEDS